MAELENLEIIIDVIDSFSDELDQLLLKLAEVEAAVQATDDIRIDVDVHGQRQLDQLVARLGALEAMDLSGVGDIVVGDKNIRRGGGGGAARFSTRQFERMDRLMETQVRQMGRMIAQMDGLGDSADGFSDAMRNSMTAADKAADQFQFTNLRMSDLHNAMANVIPLLLVFVGALPAAITGLVAVGAAALSAAAALAAIAGFGALGAAMARGDGNIGQGATDILEEIQEDFLDAFSELAMRLAPLFEDFVDGLDFFFQRVANLGGLLVALGDDASRFGAFMSDFLTGMIRDMALMVDAFAPVFSRIGSFLEQMNLLLNLTEFTSDILPDLILMTRLIIGAVVALARFSKGFLQVANAVAIVGSLLFNIITLGGRLTEEIGALAAVFLVAASAAAIYGSALWGAIIPAVSRAIGLVVSKIVALNAMSAAQLKVAASTWAVTAALYAMATAIALTGIGALAIAIGGIASRFTGLSTDIDAATQSLRSFRQERNRIGGGDNPYGSPDVGRSEGRGSSRFSGGTVNLTVEGDADDETVRNQTQNALYRLERPTRSR